MSDILSAAYDLWGPRPKPRCEVADLWWCSVSKEIVKHCGCPQGGEHTPLRDIIERLTQQGGPRE